VSHIQVLVYSDAPGHEEFHKEVNNWKYLVKGDLRDGVTQPYVSYWQLYDIRILDEKEKELMKDLSMHFASKEDDKAQSMKQLRFAAFLLRVFRKVMRLPTPDITQTERTNSPLKKWSYRFFLFRMSDPVQKDDVSGKTKRVL